MAARFTDGRVGDAGIRRLFSVEHRWQRWLDVEAALATAEADVGIVPADAAAAIVAGADVARLDVDRVQRGIAATSHPLMALVTELSDVVGPPHGGWVHWGATTQNITQTGDLLVVREAHQVFLRLLGQILEAAADRADEGADAPMAGRTHGQHAVPITFGFKVGAWIDELGRHVQRLGEVEKRVFTVMTGGAVGNFASLGAAGPSVQAGVAARLGMASMAVPSRAVNDSIVEYVSLLGLLAGTGGMIAGEVFTLMKQEFGEVDEPAPAGVIGSSTMPHKRNPQLADDCITISAQLRALVPLALESMLHDHEVDGAHSAILDETLEQACVLTGDLLIRLKVILEGLTVHPERMRANLDLTGGLISSELVMLTLGRVIGRQLAHEVVYDAAQAARDTGSFADALRADPRITAQLDDTALVELLDPASHTGLSADIAREAAARARVLARAIATPPHP
jgi:3-carboxy-cis,cis-muconate cycloisomerase